MSSSSNSRGRGRNNDVRGPTSALTSFLREKGIRPRNIVWGQNAENQEEEAATASTEQNPEQPIASSSTNATNQATTSAIEVETTPTITEKPIKPVAKKRKPNKKAVSSSDEDVPVQPNNPNSIVAICNKCHRRFARSSFVSANPSAKAEKEANLCHACLSMASGVDSATRAKARKKTSSRKMAEQYDINGEGQVDHSDGILSLKGLCIKLIAENIDQVEEFGDIGPEVRLRISRILSRHRSLNTENLKLFLTPQEEELRLFDCTQIDETGFRLIPAYAPHLTVLQLDYCGRMTDQVLTLLGEKCQNLHNITLGGPFLVTEPAWSSFFQHVGPRLTRLIVENAPKIKTQAMSTLSTVCQGGKLQELSFVRCSGLNDNAVNELLNIDCTSLNSLTLSEVSPELTDDGILPVLYVIGSSLISLDLSCNHRLTNFTLTGIRDSCTSLKKLNLSECMGLDTESLLDAFIFFKDRMVVEKEGEPGQETTLEPSEPREDPERLITDLVELKLGRLSPGTIDDGVLYALAQSTNNLRVLNVNGADTISRAGLEHLMFKCPHLSELEVSWVRVVDDNFLDWLVKKCPEIRKFEIFGCNKVTEVGAKQTRVNQKGQVIKVIGSEFD